MEETLGKRIAAHRKNLGLTQDALAEKLGVTAQAVSKWENDQSCPDITTLPKLAEIFDCTTDELLGVTAKSTQSEHQNTERKETEQPSQMQEEETNGLWELQWDGSKRVSLGIALWLLITGGISMASAVLHWGVDTWHILWSSGIMVFGLFGLLRRFSAFYLGTFLFGSYFLLWHMDILPIWLTILKWEIVIPGIFLLLGLCTLADSIRRPRKSIFQIHHNGESVIRTESHCSYDDEYFDCSNSFGATQRLITLPRLSGGKASLSFGELIVDLSGCAEVAEGCVLDVSCSFGELEIQVPRRFRVEPNIHTAFAAFETKGTPSSDVTAKIYVNGSANFGHITLRYL